MDCERDPMNFSFSKNLTFPGYLKSKTKLCDGLHCSAHSADMYSIMGGMNTCKNLLKKHI